ncbi:MAG: T9SS type A sorting domain-containing protein [Flavipsychrobacter sp.]|nr:T9SS type A sorting domain-containing protein [Flavipsychrobacter sp.]
MKSILTMLLLCACNSCYAQFAQFDWVNSYVEYGQYSYNLPSGNVVRTDAANNVYVLGEVYAPMIIDTFQVPGGMQNMYLAKYNANGQLLWLRTAVLSPTNSLNTPNSMCNGNVMAIDPAGYVYIGGNFIDTMDLNGIHLVSNSFLYADIFLAKYDTNGNIIWAKKAGGLGDDVIGGGKVFDQMGGGMHLDNEGSIYLTGNFGNYQSGITVPKSATFDTITLKADTLGSVFLAKYDTGGHVIWAKAIGSRGSQTAEPQAFDVTINGADDVFITGNFSAASIYFDSIKLLSMPQYLRTAYGHMFVAKYNKDGSAEWARLIDGKGGTFGVSLITDNTNDVIVAGLGLSDTTIFDNIYIKGSYPSINSFLAKYSASGNVLWAKSMDNYYHSNNYPTYMGMGTDGYIYMTGVFTDTVVFDGKTLISNGGYDVYLTRYNVDGNLNWLTSIGGTKDDAAFGIATDNTNAIYVTGDVQDTCTFGTFVVGDSVSHNMFIGKLTIPTAGVKQVTKIMNSIVVYPNPANSSSIVRINEGDLTEISIEDCLGRIVYEQKVSGKERVIVNTSGFVNGLYFVTVSDNETRMSTKLIIQH